MYVQVPCVISKDYTLIRSVFGLIVSAGGVFVYLYSQIYFDYIACVQNNLFLDYDVRTITAGDYSVEFKITCEQFEYWKSYYKKEDNPMSEMAQFKVYIQETLEERINKMDDLGFDDEIID